MAFRPGASPLIAALAAGALLGAAFAGAHVATSEAIREVDERIARDPASAELYLERGELERERGQPRAALADFERAARMAPGLAGVLLHKGRLYREMGRLKAARVQLGRFLALSPTTSRA